MRSLELHGLGSAISTTVEVAQMLTPEKKCLVSKIHTGTCSSPERGQGKPEIVITLVKGEAFETAPIHFDEE